MLLARYAPIGSPRYEKLSKSAEKLDKIIDWLPAQLFTIWSIFVAGMSAGKGQPDRFYFWDWSDWLIGIIGIIVITLGFSFLKTKLKIKEFEKITWVKTSKDSIYYTIAVISIFIIGWLLSQYSIFKDLTISLVLYLLYFTALSFIYSIKVKDNLIHDNKIKITHTTIGILFLLMAIYVGFIEDDPIITTTSIVSLPFLIVLLFGKHIRHLERAKFYPIFIFAMFVSSREAWFLIPLFLLFFVLRSYNYLRNQKVYPTFGVYE